MVLVKKELPVKDYNEVGWALREADRLGYNRATEDLIDIIYMGDNPE